MALLYLWMKVSWQALYATEVAESIGPTRSGQRWTALRVLRIAMRQSAVCSLRAWILIPASALLVLPLRLDLRLLPASFHGPGRQRGTWARAFDRPIESAYARSFGPARAGLCFPFKRHSRFSSPCVEYRYRGVYRLPATPLHMALLGIDTTLNRSGVNLLESSTFAAVCLGLTCTYASDPIAEVDLRVYALASARGIRTLRSRSTAGTGQDLFEQAKRYSGAAARFADTSIASAQPRGPITGARVGPRRRQGYPPASIYLAAPPADRASIAESKNPFVRFTESAMAAIRRGYRQFVAWLRELFRRPEQEADSAASKPI